LRKRKFLTPICLFIIFLLYFVFGTGWYEPARLVIKGRAANTEAIVDVQWDSGAGYNAYEQEQFQFLPTRGGLDRQHRITLAGGSTKNILSKSARIILTEIRIDDRGLYIPPEVLQSVRHVRGAGWFFETADSKVTLTVPAREQIFFSLKTNNRSGIALISIDGQETRHDLYRSNWEVLLAKLNFWFLDEQGNFSVSCAMPRYAVDSLRITVPEGTALSSVYLKTKTGRIVNLPVPEDQSDGHVLIATPTNHLKHYFHANRFVFQILFALLMTWVSCSLLKTITRYGGMKEFFLGKELRLFWLFFTGAIISYSVWLLAFWPGVMSVDSLNIWRAAWLPDVMINNHPLLNVFWYMFLLHLWNNIAVVPVSHIFLLSLLIAVTLFFCYRQGVRLRWLLLCYLLLLLSLPVSLYNVTLWKDVPFGLLVVFWSLTPAYFFFKKMKGQGIRINFGQIVLLLLLFLSLLLFRHNGMVYLFVLPILFFGLRLIQLPKTLVIIGCIVALGLFVLVVFPPNAIKGASYFHDLSRTYLQQIGQESPVKRVINAARQYPRLLDLKKNKERSDFWHYYLSDRYAYTFIREAEWNDTHTYQPPGEYFFSSLHDFALQLYNRSLEYPWVYLTWNPFWLLYLFPLSILLCRWFPLSAIFSLVILTQILALLVFVGTTNWRYYYFVLLGGYFLLPVLLLDWHRLMSQKKAIGN